MTSRNALKQWFLTGLKPTEGQFAELINSFFNLNDDQITIAMVQGLANLMGLKAALTDVAEEATLRAAGDAALQASKVDMVAGYGLSENDYTTAEKTKLANMAEHFRGVFVSVASLSVAIPVGNDGDYAVIESAGNDAVQAIWDTANNAWEEGSSPGSVASVNGQTGEVNLSTDNVGEGANNKYFTILRVLSTALTGVDFSNATNVLGTDTLLQAVGKLQAQITASSANGILSGLAVSVVGSALSVAVGTWRIGGVVYSINIPANIELNAADVTDSRIDLVYADTNNEVLVLTGIVSPNPVKPSLPKNCVEVGFALVSPTGSSAGSSAPANYVTQSEFDTIIGDKTTLVTDNTNTLVDAINEISEGLSSLNQDNIILNIFKKSNYS